MGFSPFPFDSLFISLAILDSCFAERRSIETYSGRNKWGWETRTWTARKENDADKWERWLCCRRSRKSIIIVVTEHRRTLEPIEYTGKGSHQRQRVCIFRWFGHFVIAKSRQRPIGPYNTHTEIHSIKYCSKYHWHIEGTVGVNVVIEIVAYRIDATNLHTSGRPIQHSSGQERHYAAFHCVAGKSWNRQCSRINQWHGRQRCRQQFRQW